jgi:hypothetical protein
MVANHAHSDKPTTAKPTHVFLKSQNHSAYATNNMTKLAIDVSTAPMDNFHKTLTLTNQVFADNMHRIVEAKLD